jgi:hypothetical protein
VVLYLGEAVAGGDIAGPVVEAAVAHSLDAPALAAREVVMVTAAAQEKCDLAVFAAERVGVALVGQPLQVPVHGRQPDALELAVQLLRRDRALGRAQGVDDRFSLLGSPAHSRKR